ncbi:MAG: amidohydrolase family protein [Oscillospiraceae bacterium]|nr:amidohydrolase family protein [Oscillospiraceae bacterium]
MRIYNALLRDHHTDDLHLGWITIQDGIVTEVHFGNCDAITEGDINAMNGLLLPGFIDAHCHLGIIEDGIDFEGDDCNEATDPFMPHLRAIDGINPFDMCFEDARKRGITTVLSSPGSANPAGGIIAAIKTSGVCVDRMLLRSVGVKFALGENPKSVYDHRDETPITRMATAAIIREGLFKARRYLIDTRSAEQDSDLSPPEFDIKCEALLPLLRGEQKAFFHCHRADDMATAIRIAQEFQLETVLIHATEGHRIAQYLAEKQIPVILGPLIGNRCKPELQQLSEKNAAVLAENHVNLAICTDHPEVPIQYLPLSAAIARKNGLSPAKALDSITCDAADLVGIGDRVGRIAEGYDADLQLYAPNSDPLALDTMPEWVMINGEFVNRKGEAK